MLLIQHGMLTLTYGDIVAAFGATCFAFMGCAALVAPARITEQFDIPDLSAAGRNEVRAVYGGFGLAMAALLALTIFAPALRVGIFVTVAGALAGMAAGRFASALIDRAIGRLSVFYLCVEAAGAALLFHAV